MFSPFRKNTCRSCLGRGVDDASHLGAEFLVYADLLFSLIVLATVGAGWVYFFGFNMGFVLQNLPTILAASNLWILVYLFLIPSPVKFILFDKCKSCNGSGKAPGKEG
jgi:hypothetical protein